MGVGNVRRFHMLTGPESLFEHAGVVLEQWTSGGVKLGAAHVQQRLAERKIDETLFDGFDPSEWQIVTCEVTRSKQKRLCYITARKPLDEERKRWLWAVFVHEHVVTAWVRKNAGIQRISQNIVTKGPIWEAVDRRYRQKLEDAAQLAEQAAAETTARQTGPRREESPLLVTPLAVRGEPQPERARQLFSPCWIVDAMRRWARRVRGKRGPTHG